MEVTFIDLNSMKQPAQSFGIVYTIMNKLLEEINCS